MKKELFGGSERVEKTSEGRCLLGLKADYVNIPVRSSYIDRPKLLKGTYRDSGSVFCQGPPLCDLENRERSKEVVTRIFPKSSKCEISAILRSWVSYSTDF